MPMYEYKNNEGELIEKEYSMKEGIPGKIIHKGKVYYRVYSAGLVIPEYMRAGNEEPFNFKRSRNDNGNRYVHNGFGEGKK